MTRIENHCVCCERYCIYEACPYYRTEVHYCDKCGEPAVVCTDGIDLCRDHAKEEETKK